MQHHSLPLIGMRLSAITLRFGNRNPENAIVRRSARLDPIPTFSFFDHAFIIKVIQSVINHLYI
jgi:hypothetical protein